MLRLIRALGLKRAGPPIIVVSGLPRSGTSMMMSMLNAAELELVTDRIREADTDNPKGYYEDERVKELEKTRDKSWLSECRGKVVKIISFLLKDLPDAHRYKIIFMQRSLQEVIASQNKMLTRRGEPVDPADDDRMVELYRDHLRKVELTLAQKRNLEHIDVPYGDAVANPRQQAARVAEFLGLDLDVDKMARSVDPALYRNRRKSG